MDIVEVRFILLRDELSGPLISREAAMRRVEAAARFIMTGEIEVPPVDSPAPIAD